jgi:biopolymer transport protein ExbD
MERGPARATERDREGGEAREGQPRNGGEARFLTIPVDAGGRMTSAEGNVMAVEDMRAELRRLASTANGRPIYIQANQGIPTESLQSLVAECQRAGIRNLYFAPARR